MRTLRHRALRRFGTLCVLALLLVPLALSGHQHGNTRQSSTDACAVCGATNHTPAVNTPLKPQLIPTLHNLPVVAQTVSAPVYSYQSFKAGRAPPVAFPSHVA